MMKTFLYQAAFAACLFLVSCNESKTAGGELDIIALGTAIDAPTELKASDCFKQVSYVALETNDSCLIGQGPTVRVLHDKLLVTTSQKQCYLFDKETGRFLTSVGHVGNDPEGYSNVNESWLDYPNNLIYFGGWNGNSVIYNADGSYRGELKSPFEEADFPVVTAYDYLDGQTLVAHSTGGHGYPDRVAVFRDTTVVNLFHPSGTDSISITANPENIESFSVTRSKGYGGGIIIITDKKGEVVICPVGNRFFWHQGEDVFFMEQFNDTIYRVTADALLPVRYLDFGTYRWEAMDRSNKEKNHVAYPTEMLEGKDVFLLRFVVDLYKDRIIYNALIDKESGIVKVSKYETAFKNDLDGFIPLQPESISPDGEFAQIVPADQIVTWFEENADKADIPAEVAALKQVGEEDNPIVVIMK